MDEASMEFVWKESGKHPCRVIGYGIVIYHIFKLKVSVSWFAKLFNTLTVNVENTRHKMGLPGL